MIARKKTDRVVAIHPGEYLREDFMRPLQLSVNALSLALRVPATRIAEIVNGRRGVSVPSALACTLTLRLNIGSGCRRLTIWQLARWS